MKRIQQLTEEINRLTLKIEEEYPELYTFLNENPVTIPNAAHPHMDIATFVDYLDSLKALLNQYIASHQVLRDTRRP